MSDILRISGNCAVQDAYDQSLDAQSHTCRHADMPTFHSCLRTVVVTAPAQVGLRTLRG